MKMDLLAYKDTKLNIFTAPLAQEHAEKEDVIEKARRMCAQPQLPKVYFEYDLYIIGSYDDKIGVITPFQPEFIVSLGDFKHLASEEVVDAN